jgi:hypothetical protein
MGQSPVNGYLVLRPPVGKCFVAPSLGMIPPELRSPADPRASPRGLTPWNYARRSLPARLHPDGSLTVAVPEFLVFCTLSLSISAL